MDASTWVAKRAEPSWLGRLFDNKSFLVVVCLTPALGLLLVFLTYPLGLGIYLSFTDTEIGGNGQWVGLENFIALAEDPIFINSVWNTLFYTFTATVGKFALGLWLALLLNQHIPFKSVLRAIILLPYIVPTVLSAIAFWWIYDPQFSIISYVLVNKLHILSGDTAWAQTPRRVGPARPSPVRKPHGRRCINSAPVAAPEYRAYWRTIGRVRHPYR